MTSRVAPDLSNVVAWLWRNTCAPRPAKVLIPARFERASRDGTDGVRGAEPPPRRAGAEEHLVHIHLGSRGGDIGVKRIAGVLRQGQDGLSA